MNGMAITYFEWRKKPFIQIDATTLNNAPTVKQRRQAKLVRIGVSMIASAFFLNRREKNA